MRVERRHEPLRQRSELGAAQRRRALVSRATAVRTTAARTTAARTTAARTTAARTTAARTTAARTTAARTRVRFAVGSAVRSPLAQLARAMRVSVHIVLDGGEAAEVARVERVT